MATTSNLQLTAPSSSSSCPSSWDVFLSFRGEDTRRGFIAHLYFALDQAGVLTFRDDPALEKGEEITGALLSAIHASKMFVVVISENYARSPWCLDELVEILGSERTENRVIPVFYYVDPSDLRHQKGVFGEALDHHKKRYSDDLIHKWKNALAAIAQLSGYHLKKDANQNESEIIQEIVENVERRVSTKVLHLEKYLVGTDSAVEEIYQMLRMELNHVGAIGIWGMGGSGKTTTAKAFYNKYSNIFEISCFIDKVKQYSQRRGSPLLALLNQVLTGILRKKDYKVTNVHSGFRQLKQLLCFKKALIVLDDLDQSSYSEFLVTLCDLFWAGSRVIVTTRDLNLLNQLRIDITDVDIYMVKKLGQVDSLELFSYHAFTTPTPPANLRVLSESFVSYAGGLPLALKVLGSSLHGRTHDVLFWKAKLEKIKEIPEKGILEILRLSYDELDGDTDKAIFLDIAFFFVGKYITDAVEIFESCDFFPKVGITILVERCLLEIDENNKFQMHDLIQDMGRKLGKSTHLLWRGNALRDLQNQEGIDKIEVLILDLALSTDKLMNSKIFEKLPRLRLLEIFNADGIINGHFRNSFHELRSIYWSYCTWTRLPSSFKPPKLVSLHMPYSNFRILWNSAMPFMSLKTINVEDSVKLKMTPDFENTKLIERLYFSGCESLRKVHPSIRELTRLYALDLRECTHLKELAEPVGQLTVLDHLYLYSFVKRSPEPMEQWANMGYLYLGHCTNLRQLPKQLGDMKGLKLVDASYTAVEELPDSITQLTELVVLDLSGCRKLIKLPEQIGNMEGLAKFSAGNTALEQLPDSFVCLINLERLDLSYCKNLRNLPDSIWKLKLLKVLELDSCSNLERLPEELGKMQCLECLDASLTAIEQVPDSVGLLSRLQMLGLSRCKKLKYVPNSVWNLTSLTHLSLLQAHVCEINLPDTTTVKDTKLVVLSLNCDIRLWLPMILSLSSLKKLFLRDEGECLSPTEPFSLSKLDNLQFLELYDCPSFGSSGFPELPPSLTHLSLCDLYSCRTLGLLSSLAQLKTLEICNCINLESLASLPPRLKSLKVYDCTSLRHVPDMSMLKDLVSLSFGGCTKLESVGLVRRRQFLLRSNNKAVGVPKIAEWFSYKSSGRTLRFDIPPLLGENLLGLALWVLLTSKNSRVFNIRAVVTNKTNGITKLLWIPVYSVRGAEEYSLVKCTTADEILITSGDSIRISFDRQLYGIQGGGGVPNEQVKIEMCAAHVMQISPTTPDFPSVLNHLINLA